MAIEFTCPQCGTIVGVEHAGDVRSCPACKQKVGKVVQLDQLLARWWEPRRWRADLVKPNVPYLVERLWTANGQGERLYQAIAPRHTNYDIFRNLVTRRLAKGIEEGWVALQFPPDPLVEDPVYRLEFKDPERFAGEVERLFPDVDWSAPVEVSGSEVSGSAEDVGRSATRPG